MSPIIKTLSFIALLAVVIMFLNYIFIPKSEVYYKCGQAPYNEKQNSLDVVFIGSSHVEWGIDPNTLWENFGIPSINYTVPGLDLKNSYFLFKEIVKYQKPKVIVIDVWKFNNENDAVPLTNRISNIFPLSMNKIEMINSNEKLDSLSKKLDYYFPLYLYHTRKLEPIDLTFNYENIERGHFVNFDQINLPFPFDENNETVKLSAIEESYFMRILQFASQENIKIIFTSIPHLKKPIDQEKKINALGQLAKKNNVEWFDFNKIPTFIAASLIYETDIANDTELNSHINHKGAVKVTNFLGNILKEKYSLIDKRNNTDFKYLTENSIKFREKIKTDFPFSVPGKGNRLDMKMSLKIGEYLNSGNNKYKLLMQSDGNLVLYNEQNSPLWGSYTDGKPAKICTMQEDGNLVIYGDNFIPYWATNTPGNNNTYCILQDDGNVVIYSDKKAIWASNTAVH